MNNKIKPIEQRLHDELLKLEKKYKSEVTAPVLSFHLISLITLMMADMAPSLEEARRVVEEAVEAAFAQYERYRKLREGSNEEND